MNPTRTHTIASLVITATIRCFFSSVRHRVLSPFSFRIVSDDVFCQASAPSPLPSSSFFSSVFSRILRPRFCWRRSAAARMASSWLRALDPANSSASLRPGLSIAPPTGTIGWAASIVANAFSSCMSIFLWTLYSGWLDPWSLLESIYLPVLLQGARAAARCTHVQIPL
jgi:hypothetical protein